MADIDVTVQQSGGTYSTLEGAIAGQAAIDGDLVTQAGKFNVDITGAWTIDDTTVVDITGYTTNSSFFINIFTSGDSRHGGQPDGGYRLVTSGNANRLTIDQEFTRLQGIEISLEGTINNSNEAIRCGDSHDGSTIDKCLLHTATGVNDCDGIYQTNNAAQPDTVSINIYNCIIYGFPRSGIKLQSVTNNSDTQNMVIRNCTVVLCGEVAETEGGCINIRKSRTNTTVNITIYNTIAMDTVDIEDDIGDFGTDTATITWVGDANVTSDGSATLVDDGSNSILNAISGDDPSPPAGTRVIFVDVDSPFDWHIQKDADNDILDQGLNAQIPPSPYAADIDYETREDPPDMGADDVTAIVAAAFTGRMIIF